MTGVARVAQSAFMLVIFLVAGDAFHGCILEERAFVTGFALNARMLAA